VCKLVLIWASSPSTVTAFSPLQLCDGHRVQLHCTSPSICIHDGRFGWPWIQRTADRLDPHCKYSSAGEFRNMDPYKMFFLTPCGKTQAAFTLLLVPRLQRRFGTARMVKINSLLYAPLFCFFPIMNVFARSDNWPGVIVTLGVLVVWASAMSMSYSESWGGLT
jgi:hypothetical protein